MPAIQHLATEMEHLRIERGWSYAKLSEILQEAGPQISRSTIHLVFKGDRVPSWDLLSSIVKVLGGNREQFEDLWREAIQEQLREQDARSQAKTTIEAINGITPGELKAMTKLLEAMREIDTGVFRFSDIIMVKHEDRVVVRKMRQEELSALDQFLDHPAELLKHLDKE